MKYSAKTGNIKQNVMLMSDNGENGLIPSCIKSIDSVKTYNITVLSSNIITHLDCRFVSLRQQWISLLHGYYNENDSIYPMQSHTIVGHMPTFVRT